MNIKIPVSWLREYIKTDIATKTIAAYLTASGPSVEYMKKVAEDYIFDIEVTTNRSDAYSVFGIAREAHAILKSNNEKSELVTPAGLNLNLDPDKSNKIPLDVIIKDSKLCPRFTAIVLEVKIGQSPAYIKNRLISSGVRPINNIVDLTNYIMLETGQPMHAFDYDKIIGSRMILRKSLEGEKINTLDGQKHLLPKGSIVIEDAKRLIDLCGIMGGENSQITSRTKRTIFFVQSYDPKTIRKTTQALAFRTEASARFEKGVDLDNILPTLSRAVYLAKNTAGAKIISELVDIYSAKQHQPKVKLNMTKLHKYLGVELNIQKAASILENLGFKVSIIQNQIEATAPTWRASDIKTDVDLIEEIARIYGYHNLPSTLPKGEPPQRTDGILKKVIELKKTLKYFGLTEVMTYSIISKQMLKFSKVNEKTSVELANPLTEEWQFMRPSLIPSLVEVISKNYHLKSDISIFEIAKTYVKKGSGLPIQDLYLTITINNVDFYQIKGLVENIIKTIKQKTTYSKLKSEKTLFDPNQSAQIKIGDLDVGFVGILKTDLVKNFDLKTPIASIELNLSKIYDLPSLTKSYHPISKFPPIKEDISAIFSVHTPITDIITEIKKASTLVKKTEVIDIYENPTLGDGKKSIAFSLTYQKSSATPTQEEVNKERALITRALETNLRAKVRV